MINSLLKVELAKKNMTQTELSRITGIRQPTISQIALGTIKHFPIEAMDKICKALNCQPGDIMEYKEDITMYEVYLNNRDSIFDSQRGFESVEAALEWASGREGTYVAQISREGVEAPGISISITGNNGESTYSYYCIDRWLTITATEIAKMI